MTLTYQKDNRYDREVYCPKCCIYSHRSDDGPKCWNCGSWLHRVQYSIITGERLTGTLKKEEEIDRKTENDSISTGSD